MYSTPEPKYPTGRKVTVVLTHGEVVGAQRMMFCWLYRIDLGDGRMIEVAESSLRFPWWLLREWLLWGLLWIAIIAVTPILFPVFLALRFWHQDDR